MIAEAGSPRAIENQHPMSTSSPPRTGTGAGQQALREFLASRTNVPPALCVKPVAGSARDSINTIADNWTSDSPPTAEGGESLWQKWLRDARGGQLPQQPSVQDLPRQQAASFPSGSSASYQQETSAVEPHLEQERRSIGTGEMVRKEERSEAVVLKKRIEPAGVFGVGLQLSADVPHVVQRVSFGIAVCVRFGVRGSVCVLGSCCASTCQRAWVFPCLLAWLSLSICVRVLRKEYFLEERAGQKREGWKHGGREGFEWKEAEKGTDFIRTQRIEVLWCASVIKDLWSGRSRHVRMMIQERLSVESRAFT